MMFGHQQRIPVIYPASQYFYPNPRVPFTQSALVDFNWTLSWPIIRTILLGSFMIIINAAIVGLEIANLAIEGTKGSNASFMGYGTARVGAGIWTGSISFIAAIFIIVIIFVRNKRVAATFALLATTLAFFFSIVLVGLTANALQIDHYAIFSFALETRQYKLIIAILSLAATNILFCLLFFLMYICVFFSSSTRQAFKY